MVVGNLMHWLNYFVFVKRLRKGTPSKSNFLTPHPKHMLWVLDEKKSHFFAKKKILSKPKRDAPQQIFQGEFTLSLLAATFVVC